MPGTSRFRGETVKPAERCPLVGARPYETACHPWIGVKRGSSERTAAPAEGGGNNARSGRLWESSSMSLGCEHASDKWKSRRGCRFRAARDHAEPIVPLRDARVARY